MSSEESDDIPLDLPESAVRVFFGVVEGSVTEMNVRLLKRTVPPCTSSDSVLGFGGLMS